MAGGSVNRSGGASTRAASLLLLVMISVYGAAATEFPVGGTLGWRLGVDYSDWAKSVTISKGDTLSFEYPAGAHNALLVSADDYANCDGSNALVYMSSGNDKFTVSDVGTYHFICGFEEPCGFAFLSAVCVTMRSEFSMVERIQICHHHEGGRITNKALSLWASEKMGKPINEMTISRILIRKIKLLGSDVGSNRKHYR
ncbi:hypothetical protein R1flu_002701 [Riccia fluitans]|uniref:Phytocyanin domain-containing protein n=1 Tax=Riccia fluitans TaxID=41844 RepID=A0ABD1Y6X9_9MARC